MGCCCPCCSNPGYEMFNRWFMLVATLISFVLSIVTLSACNYIKNSVISVGLFGSKVVGLTSCVSYEGDTVDGAHVASQAGGVISAVCLGLAVIGQLLITLILPEKPSKIIWSICRGLIPIAFIGNMMVPAFLFSVHEVCTDTLFGGFDADNIEDDGVSFGIGDIFDCEIGAAGRVTGVNWIILIVLMILMCCVPVPENPLFCKRGGGGAADSGERSTEDKGDEKYA